VGCCFLSQFIKRVRWVDPLENADFEVVIEVVLLAVCTNPEFLSNGLAVDFVEQRVQVLGNRMGEIELILLAENT